MKLCPFTDCREHSRLGSAIQQHGPGRRHEVGHMDWRREGWNRDLLHYGLNQQFPSSSERTDVRPYGVGVRRRAVGADRGVEWKVSLLSRSFTGPAGIYDRLSGLVGSHPQARNANQAPGGENSAAFRLEWLHLVRHAPATSK